MTTDEALLWVQESCSTDAETAIEVAEALAAEVQSLRDVLGRARARIRSNKARIIDLDGRVDRAIEMLEKSATSPLPADHIWEHVMAILRGSP